MDASVKVGAIETQEWSTVEVCFPRFTEYSAVAGDWEESPEFTCCGNRWSVVMYPGGDGEEESDDEMTSIYLANNSYDRIKAKFEIILRGPNNAMITYHYGEPEGNVFGPSEKADFSEWGSSKFAERSEVIESLIEGAMVVDVKISRLDTMPESPFVPENPHLKNSAKLFMDEETADVVFKVIWNKRGKRKRGEQSTDFHAHRLVLKHNAPVLAEFCGQGEGEAELPVTVPIEDVDPDIFRHLLYYVYGGEIEGGDLDAKAKDIIDAADRYGVVGLKLLAEARYVESTKLSIKNMMEHLLFADAKNCALMKEAVLDFVLANDAEVLEKVSFDDCPAGLTKDLLAAMARSKRSGKSDGGNAEDRFLAMRVNDLRRELHEKGLDIDGSREAMIAALRESS